MLLVQCRLYLSTVVHCAFVILNIMAGPSISIPNIRNLNLNLMVCSVHVFMAINSLENVLDSNAECRLLSNIIGALFTNITYPIFDLLVLLSNSCDVYTNAVIVSDLSLGYGIYFVNSSMEFQYCSLNYSAELP